MGVRLLQFSRPFTRAITGQAPLGPTMLTQRRLLSGVSAFDYAQAELCDSEHGGARQCERHGCT